MAMAKLVDSSNILKQILFRKEKPKNIDYGENCWCESIRPLLYLSQLIGNSPLTYNCRKPNSRECLIEQKTLSPSSIYNLILLILYSAFAVGLALYRSPIIHSITTGQDGRIYTFEVISIFLHTVAVIFFARFNTSSISKVWSILNEISSPGLLNVLPSKTFRRGIRFVTFGIFISTIGFMICLGKVSSNVCNSTDEFKKACDDTPGNNNPLLASFSGLIISNSSTLAASLLTFALLIRQLNKKLAKDLEETLMPESPKKGILFTNPSRIEKLRHIHLSLQKCVVHLREYYGIPCLIVCCGSVIQLSGGFYWLFLYSEGFTAEESIFISYIILLMLQSFYFASLNLVGILVAGQIISDSVSRGFRI
jgi:hypothetical protein